jgi:hypothetical protein
MLASILIQSGQSGDGKPGDQTDPGGTDGMFIQSVRLSRGSSRPRVPPALTRRRLPCAGCKRQRISSTGPGGRNGFVAGAIPMAGDREIQHLETFLERIVWLGRVCKAEVGVVPPLPTSRFDELLAVESRTSELS